MYETRQEDERRWRAWMAAAQRGDGSSYEKLLTELIPHLTRFIRRRLRDPVAAEDVLQNVFVSLHRARHTYRPERPFRPWLYAVARNAVIDCARSRSRAQQREISLEADGVPEPVAAPRDDTDHEISPELARALAGLPPNQREAVELIQIRGLSVAEAAAQVGVSKGALKVRAHRGYRAMRVLLKGGAP